MGRRVIAILIGTAVPLLMHANEPDPRSDLDAAHQLFYDARYADAVAATTELCAADVAALSACELRTSALHALLRRAMGEGTDRKKALDACAECPQLLESFLAEVTRSTDVARARLKVAPGEEQTLFLLSKINLNYVWLQLGTLGRKAGWDEYWEARKSLDKLLKANPRNVRAKVARAWVDYIVDTRVPRGARWLLGGGSKKRALLAVRDAAGADGDTFVRAEARFALWDMQLREKDTAGARVTALDLARDFPANPDLRKFLDADASLASR